MSDRVVSFSSRRLIPDHNGPRSDFPPRHQSPGDIGIIPGERFYDRAIGYEEDKQSAVGRLGERAGQEQFAATMGFPRESQMLVSILGPARHKVRDHIVE
jgi:hypothetical protein